MKKVFMVLMVALLGISFMGISSAIAGECGPVGTGTPGYWKNHPEAWPVNVVWIGPVSCIKEDCIKILDSPVKNDKWVTLFKAYVAASLNVEIGNCPPMCQTAWGPVGIGTAHDWLDFNQTLRPVKANSDEWQYSHGEAQYWCLDDYNNGLLDMPSRDALE